MTQNNIKITANKQKDEPSRLKRLNTIYKIYKLAIKDKGPTVPFACKAKIVALHDHKGLITVAWDREPASYKMDIIGSIVSDLFYEVFPDHRLETSKPKKTKAKNGTK